MPQKVKIIQVSCVVLVDGDGDNARWALIITSAQEGSNTMRTVLEAGHIRLYVMNAHTMYCTFSIVQDKGLLAPERLQLVLGNRFPVIVELVACQTR